mgnify:CR=1 FL=1|jgi:hypothetical protein
MFYTPILLHSLSKVIGNYHRIFIHEQPNMSTFNAEFIDPSQLSLPVHQLPYLQNEIFYQNSSYFTLRRLPVPWQQYYVPLCVVPSGLYSRYVNSDVNYDMVVPLIRTSCINEEYIPNWSSLEYTYVGVSRCINMWNLLTLTSWVVPWSIVDI